MSLNIKENILLAPHTIYKIGGPAQFIAEVRSLEELKEALEFAAERELPIFILGAGSNVLVSDKGFDGRGNYTLGVKEQIIFPEISIDKVQKINGMDITFVTTAKSDEESYELLKALGMPFVHKN